MKINPSKSKAIRFTRGRVKDPLNYSLMGILIPEARSCKYLGIMLRSDLSWADQVNYTVKKAWKALHFTMRILEKGNGNTKRLAYMSLVQGSSNMTGTHLCVNKPQSVPVIFEPPCTSDSRIWGRVLGSVQGGTNKCVRQGAKESGQICTSYEQSGLGNFGVA